MQPNWHNRMMVNPVVCLVCNRSARGLHTSPIIKRTLGSYVSSHGKRHRDREEILFGTLTAYPWRLSLPTAQTRTSAQPGATLRRRKVRSRASPRQACSGVEGDSQSIWWPLHVDARNPSHRSAWIVPAPSAAHEFEYRVGFSLKPKPWPVVPRPRSCCTQR